MKKKTDLGKVRLDLVSFLLNNYIRFYILYMLNDINTNDFVELKDIFMDHQPGGLNKLNTFTLTGMIFDKIGYVIKSVQNSH